MLPTILRCFWPIALSFTVFSVTTLADEIPIDFSAHIRPLLSDHCFACHGPDESKRESGVRLDTADGVASVIDRDAWTDSLLIERIRTADPDLVMPPPEYHKPLDEKSKSLLERWVQGGAEFEAHWAFVPPVVREPPSAPQTPADADPIDHWIEAKIHESSLRSNAEADRYTLARRSALDLTGVPPNWSDVRTFVNDPDPNAYEKWVDRLIASPAYGEQMARYWLDLVRYGDTHGLHLDNYREMWPYRDWVITAMNENKPMDVFITEQLAGDLLPDATIDQQIASGFNRLNVTTSEGGSIYEEVFARNVIDRTDAFGTIFLGLTTGCAVCHDHKFDPILQRDYFSLSAFFNSLDGRALDGNAKDHPPVIRVPTDEQTRKLAEADTEIAAIEQQRRGPLDEVDAAQAAWVASLTSQSSASFVGLQPVDAKSESGTATEIMDENVVRITGDVAPKDTIEITCDLPAGQWRTLELTALVDDQNRRVGVSSNGNAVLSEIGLHVRNESDAAWQPISIASATASRQQNDAEFAVAKAIDGKVDADQGWAVAGHEAEGERAAWFRLQTPLTSSQAKPTQLRISLHYQSKFGQHLLRDVAFRVHESADAVAASQKITFGDVHVLGPLPIGEIPPAYDTDFAGEQKDALDPQSELTFADRPYRWQHRADVLPVIVNELPSRKEQPSVSVIHQTIHSPSEQSVSLLVGSDDGYRIDLNGSKVAVKTGERSLEPLVDSHELKLRAGENHLLIKHVHHAGPARLTFAIGSRSVVIPPRLATELTKVAIEGSPADRLSLQRFYRDHHCDAPQWLALQDMQRGLEKLKDEIKKEIPTTLVWKETATPRVAHILLRGQYDAPGEAVSRAVPSFLPPLPSPDSDASKAADAGVNRLTLAKWLTSPDHPLTARVAVNRFWQQLFGNGLVKTSEDFGNQGSPPSHPELLDQLAIDFQRGGWDMKALMKRLVMTRAYRRDATAAASMLTVDPNNRLLARGPRYRLDAEVLRDQTLALSGLLVDQLGGPSVKPPQPPGLWEAVGYTDSNTAVFVADEGEKTYRRSVYTFWKRTSAPAVMATFDAPSRESCTARRERTNTPLQALLLLNEPQTLEASRQLATLATGWPEPPTARARLQALFEQVVLRPPSDTELESLFQLLNDLTNYYRNDLDQAARLVKTPDASLAAWTIVSNTLFNLDEVVCK